MVSLVHHDTDNLRWYPIQKDALKRDFEWLLKFTNEYIRMPRNVGAGVYYQDQQGLTLFEIELHYSNNGEDIHTHEMRFNLMDQKQIVVPFEKGAANGFNAIAQELADQIREAIVDAGFDSIFDLVDLDILKALPETYGAW